MTIAQRENLDLRELDHCTARKYKRNRDKLLEDERIYAVVVALLVLLTETSENGLGMRFL